jgi:hypothetical protein
LNTIRPRETQTYEEPTSADLIFDATSQPPEETAEAIFQLLIDRGFLVLEDEQKNGQVKAKTAESKQVAGQFA